MVNQKIGLLRGRFIMTDFQKEFEALDAAANDLNMQKEQLRYIYEIEKKLMAMKEEVTSLKGEEFTLRKIAEDENTSEVEKQARLLEAAKIKEHYGQLEKQIIEVEHELKQRQYNPAGKKFNKYVCFSNIRELLKTCDVKIGQIEKEAGCQAGYMSRLEKKTNATEPSLEFLLTASQMLRVSLDVLTTVDLTALNPTEKYLVTFIQKLNQDTIDDKLEWNRESADSLNRMESDENGYVWHPLFDYETFYEEGECDYPDQVTRIVFTSRAFDCNTYIAGDCFNLKMKNKSTLYLMDISKSVYRTGDSDVDAKEVWIYTPGVGTQFLVSNHDISQIANLVEILFDTVKKCMKHPKVKKEIKSIIDAFMRGDLGEDDLDLPFN